VGIPKEIPDASFSTDTILAIGEHRGAGQNTWQICRKKGGVNLALLYTRCVTRDLVLEFASNLGVPFLPASKLDDGK